MKLNIANPLTGAQAMVEIEDDRKLAVLYDRRIAQEVPGDELGDEFKGYVFKITGGCDKQGFPMKQGVLVPHRVRLLLGKQPGFWRPNRDGATRRRSVRGCIVASDIAMLNLVLVKQGETPLPALERVLPRRLGPKRASKIRKLFNLSKKDDVRKYVVRRELPGKPKDKKPRTKAPKIQRLITPRMLQHKRRLLALKKRWSAKSRADAVEYAALLSARKAEKLSKLSRKSSERKSEKRAAAAASGTAAAKPAKAAGKAAAKPAKAAAAPAAAAAKPVVVATTTAASGAGKKKKASGKK